MAKKKKIKDHEHCDPSNTCWQDRAPCPAGAKSPTKERQKAMKKKNPDVLVSNHGTIFLFALLTERAQEWVKENVSEERQFLGGSLAVEHRFARDLADGMIAAGLEVK